jgi:hypothetical protein
LPILIVAKPTAGNTLPTSIPETDLKIATCFAQEGSCSCTANALHITASTILVTTQGQGAVFVCVTVNTAIRDTLPFLFITEIETQNTVGIVWSPTPPLLNTLRMTGLVFAVLWRGERIIYFSHNLSAGVRQVNGAEAGGEVPKITQSGIPGH